MLISFLANYKQLWTYKISNLAKKSANLKYVPRCHKPLENLGIFDQNNKYHGFRQKHTC